MGVGMRWVRIVLVFALALCAPLGAALAAPWHRAESANFIIYAEGPAEEARDLAMELERFRAALIMLTRAKAVPTANAPKITVYRLARRDDMLALTPGGSGVAGFYRADQTGVRAFSLEDEDSALSGRTILQHEYAHHFMYQYFSGVYPFWYSEGFAEYVSTARVSDGRMVFGGVDPLRAGWLRDERWFPLSQLITVENRLVSDNDVGRIYAKSWLTMHFMFSTVERQKMLRAYIDAYRTGVEPIAAFTTAFKEKPPEVDQEIKRYARAGLPTILLKLDEIDPQTIQTTELPDSAGRALVMAEQVRAFRGQLRDAQRGAELRARIRALPADPLVNNLQVEMEARIGQPQAALDRLAQVTNPADAGLWEAVARLRRAKTLEGDARIEEVRAARRALIAAQKQDPGRSEILFRYVQTFADAEGPPSQALIDVARRLYEISPQSFNSNVAAAMVLSRSGAGKEAAALMRIFAADPHGGDDAKRAAAFEEVAKAGGVIAPDDETWRLAPWPEAKPAAPAQRR